MLKPTFKKNDVVTLKLASGEELIATFIEESSTSFEIKKPMSVTITGQGLGLVPWVFSASAHASFDLPKDKVFLISDTLKDLADQYIQNTTGITLAKG
jgi:hypothetical protein